MNEETRQLLRNYKMTLNEAAIWNGLCEHVISSCEILGVYKDSKELIDKRLNIIRGYYTYHCGYSEEYGYFDVIYGDRGSFTVNSFVNERDLEYYYLHDILKSIYSKSEAENRVHLEKKWKYRRGAFHNDAWTFIENKNEFEYLSVYDGRVYIFENILKALIKVFGPKLCMKEIYRYTYFLNNSVSNLHFVYDFHEGSFYEFNTEYNEVPVRLLNEKNEDHHVLVLEVCKKILELDEKMFWVSKINKCIEGYKAYGDDHLIHSYIGGMGSLNDLYLGFEHKHLSIEKKKILSKIFDVSLSMSIHGTNYYFDNDSKFRLHCLQCTRCGCIQVNHVDVIDYSLNNTLPMILFSFRDMNDVEALINSVLVDDLNWLIKRNKRVLLKARSLGIIYTNNEKSISCCECLGNTQRNMYMKLE